MDMHRRTRKHKKIRSRAKWAVVLLLLLSLGAAAEYLRLEVNHSAVTVTAPFRPQYSANEDPGSSIALAKNLSGIMEFTNQYEVSGDGQKIAVIDSGIDLSHEVFCNVPNDVRKIAAYYDYTDEGLLYTQAVKQDGDKVSLGGTQYRIGSIYNQADTFYMTFFDLQLLEPKMLDGASVPMAVLVTAIGEAYDCVYIDTNRNCDFTDELPLYTYQNGGNQITLYQAGYPINCVVSEIADDGRRVQISADTLGHGTFLASVIAANGDSYQGVSPEAQLYIYKIFDKNGASSQQKLAQAIVQAVQDGVDCINLSLSVPREELILPALSSALNMAREADIPVIAAAGNYGPGKDTVAYPARESSVIGVGGVSNPAQYLADKAVYLEDCFIPDYSGRGQLDGSVSPLVVAPSSVIAAVPGWYQEQYMYDYGTSISAAIVTGAVSLLQEAVQDGAVSGYAKLTPDQIMKILALWAEDLSFPGYEQGYGAFFMGLIPEKPEQLSLPAHNTASPTIYRLEESAIGKCESPDKKKELYWQFSVPQGYSQSWHVIVPENMKSLHVSFAVNTEPPGSPLDHLIALGRCRMYLYNPDGALIDATPYIGASYGRELITSDEIAVWLPQKGDWEIVVTSADNLSLYNHFASFGMIHVSAE